MKGRILKPESYAAEAAELTEWLERTGTPPSRLARRCTTAGTHIKRIAGGLGGVKDHMLARILKVIRANPGGLPEQHVIPMKVDAGNLKLTSEQIDERRRQRAEARERWVRDNLAAESPGLRGKRWSQRDVMDMPA